MSKKIYIGENNLINIKNAMAGKNISHSTFMSEDKPPYEKDEYEIGGEGGNNDFFHVNESYGFSRNVDLSEVGRVNYTWDFDEDYYHEWLEDNEYADNEDIKLQYIKEGNVEFELDFCDNQTYHSMGSDSVYYDDLEDLFGERMAETILKNCIEDGSGYFETEELYYDDNFDINSPSELDDMAMKVLRHGEYYKDCRGFILSNGVVVYTDMEHNEVTRIPGINDKFQFIELGNIRVLNHSIDIGKEPTRQQYDVLKQVLRTYDGEELYLDIFCNNSEIGAHYPVCNPNYVLGEITRFYSEGIKPQGGTFYEEKQVVKENTFEKWFEGSVLVDEDGKPIKMYHGTSKKFDSFSKDFINSSGAGAYEGYGFNFTPHWSTAAHYSTDGNIIEAYLSVKHPLKSTENTLSLNTVMKVIAEIDKGVPVTDRIVVAFESPRYNENWDEVYYKRALRKAAQSIIEYNGEDYGNAGIYAGVCESGQGNPKKTIEAFEKLGYDSAIFYDENGKIRTVIVFEPNQIKLVNNKTFSIDSDIMSENIESKRYKKIIMPENKLITIKENIENEVEANEVSLDSFKKQKELVPKIWDGDELNSRVRLKLLDIADDFWETTDIGWVRPKRIVLMGSICNYNWSKSSDIDLHLQVDFSEVDEKKDFVQEYFNGKKNKWNEEHSNLKIFGFPVEVYVEDIDADTNSGGIYDLEENDWIKKPSKDGIKQIGLNKYSIKDKSAKIMTDIDDLYDLFKKTDDDAKLRKIGEKARHILDYVKAMRKNGLSRGGESDKDNIVYKVLRRTGYMDTLWNLSSQLYDKLNSIDEVTEGQAELILEYLEDKHNFPLYQYFKWAKSATDKDKAIDLLRQCGDVAIKYLETRNANQCDELRDLRIRLKREGEDAQYENDFIEAFGNGIANNGLMRDFEFFMRYRGDFYELPSWMTMDFNRIVKNEWCIHFCYDADSIAREGFKWGTDDIGKLALTGAGMEKPSEGYNFAFPVGEYHIDNNSYGSFNPSTRQRGSQEAVIFQTSGVEVYHEGDEQNQVVFWGPNAKNFIPIKYDREQGGWCIYGNKGQVLYTGKPSKILEWVLTNLPQYRKQIMVGKNGVSLKENTDLFALAKERFGTTYDIRECGYILPDGSMLDFSGRHMVTGDTSHLRGRRGIDHRDISDLQWDKELKVRTNVNVNMADFIRSGAIRIHCSNTWSSINLFKKPTKQQANVLIRLIQYSKGNVTVEIGDGDNSYEYAEWDEANPRRVINDIIRYFDGETIKLVGNVVENKVIKEYFNKYCCLNEEVVADGNAGHNPFKQRWKHERETLINYLVNYGELMTSKENGKQYKVLFDEMLSNRIGFNYCLCIQWNPLTMEPGNVIYVRAYDKFTKKIFRPQFDYRGRDNLEGTLDDVV